jgi:hypothetical protein
VGLVSGGWGDTVEDAVGWFADPLAGGTCIVPGCYSVMEEYGELRGFCGLRLRPLPVSVDDEGHALFAEMWADVVGVVMPRIELPRVAFVRDMLIGSVPLADA